MDYKNIYDNLVIKAKPRGLNKKTLEGYFEKHHILPKCMGGDNSKENLVLFTGREHYIAHRLLNKIHPENKSLFYALLQMSMDPREFREIPVNARNYASLREKFSEGQKGSLNPASKLEVREKMSLARKGKPSSFKGKKFSEESKAKLRASKVGKVAGELNPMFGKKHSEETRRKIAEKATGRESKLKGRPLSQETRDRISQKLKGIPNPGTRSRIKALNLQPWETGRAKNNPISLNYCL